MASQKPHIPSPARKLQAGFTLVEVALAIGIVAFAFVALIALIPAGQTAFRRSVDITVCSQISQRVIGEAQQTDFDTLIDQIHLNSTDPNYTFRGPTVGAPAFRYFDDQGREILTNSNGTPLAGTGASANFNRAIYVVNTRIQPNYQLPTTGQATSNATSTAPQPLAMITVQVAHAPGIPTLTLNNMLSTAVNNDPLSPDRCLWVTTAATPAGIEILTYSAFIGRND